MVLKEGNVGKKSIEKKLGMYATHQKKLNNDRMFSVDLSLWRIMRKILL